MDDAKRLVDKVEADEARYGISPEARSNLFKRVLKILLARGRRGPDSSGDPFSYVRVPVKPRLPHLSAAAKAELDD